MVKLNSFLRCRGGLQIVLFSPFSECELPVVHQFLSAMRLVNRSSVSYFPARGPVKLIEVRVSEGGKVEKEGENRGSLGLAS